MAEMAASSGFASAASPPCSPSSAGCGYTRVSNSTHAGGGCARDAQRTRLGARNGGGTVRGRPNLCEEAKCVHQRLPT